MQALEFTQTNNSLQPSIEKVLNKLNPQVEYKIEERYTNLNIRNVIEEYLKSTTNN